MDVNNYKYIEGALTCNDVGNRYWIWGSSNSYHDFVIDFESVKISGDGRLAYLWDDHDHWWELSRSNGYLVFKYRYSWNGGSNYATQTVTFDDLVIANAWKHIRIEVTGVSGSNTTFKGTVDGSTQSKTVSGWGTYTNNWGMILGSSGTTIRGKVTVAGYNYGSSKSTMVIDCDSVATGSTGIYSSGDGSSNHFNLDAGKSVEEEHVQHTLTFDPNGGTGTIAPITKYGGVAATLPSGGFTKTGYHMTAWRFRNAISGTIYALGGTFTLDADATFYAQWTNNVYKVRFNANGGTGTMADQSIVYGETKALNANAFTRSGFEFVGWATSDTGAKVYDNEQEVTNLGTDDGEIVNLYAVWKAQGGSVYYNGAWHKGQVFGKVNGVWKEGMFYGKANGTWKEGS